MKTHDLSGLITSFFRSHLAAERNLSQHTTHAYRDALKLFLRFAADWHERQTDRLAIGDLTAEVQCQPCQPPGERPDPRQ